ncbi:hypothetical protein [Kangiella marina]|uniref:DUF4375 domain-containing protein n=1 Tax=Kangiella marina TaxID=1079178 RepID=A0ABP8IMG4_9GAMM
MLLILTVTALVAWNFYGVKENIASDNRQEQNEIEIELSKEKFSDIVGHEDEKEVKPDIKLTGKPVFKNSAKCHQWFQEHENWKEINDIFESLYMSIEEMTGEHYFQQMPLEAVKSYADAGNPDAMFHYGTEVIWKNGFGFYFNDLNRTQVLSQQERQELANSHQLDLPMLEEGAKYLMDAAVAGKLGGIIELTTLHHYILKRQIESSNNKESIKNAMILSIAYRSLLQQVFAKDIDLMEGFLYSNQSDDLLDKYSKQFPDTDLQAVHTEANNIQKRLFDYWRQNREVLGLPLYPDRFPAHLEQHMKNKNKECG